MHVDTQPTLREDTALQVLILILLKAFILVGVVKNVLPLFVLK